MAGLDFQFLFGNPVSKTKKRTKSKKVAKRKKSTKINKKGSTMARRRKKRRASRKKSVKGKKRNPRIVAQKGTQFRTWTYKTKSQIKKAEKKAKSLKARIGLDKKRALKKSLSVDERKAAMRRMKANQADLKALDSAISAAKTQSKKVPRLRSILKRKGFKVKTVKTGEEKRLEELEKKMAKKKRRKKKSKKKAAAPKRRKKRKSKKKASAPKRRRKKRKSSKKKAAAPKRRKKRKSSSKKKASAPKRRRKKRKSSKKKVKVSQKRKSKAKGKKRKSRRKKKRSSKAKRAAAAQRTYKSLRRLKKGKRKQVRMKVGKKVRRFSVKRTNPKGGQMAKVGEALTGGQSLQELSFLAVGGAASKVVEQLISQFAPAALKDVLSKVPVAGASSLLAGAAVYAIGDQVKNKMAKDVGRALVAVAAVQAGSTVGAIATSVMAPAPTGTAGVSYHPDFSGVDVKPYGRAEFDIGVEGVPRGLAGQLGAGQLGRRADQLNPHADFEGMGNGVPEGLDNGSSMG